LTRWNAIRLGAFTLFFGVFGAMTGIADERSAFEEINEKLASRGGEITKVGVLKNGCKGRDELNENAPFEYAAQFINCDDLRGEDIALLERIPNLTSLDLRLSRVAPDVLLAVARLRQLNAISRFFPRCHRSFTSN
jgi:hypothetical protein